MCTSTFAGPWQHLEQGERVHIFAAMHARGLHLTAQREAILEAIFGCPGHICAEHILGAVLDRRPTLRMNKTTVYRALNLLVDMRLVREHRVGAGPAQYEPASRGPHTHLICRACGQSWNLDGDVVQGFTASLRARDGFEAQLESYPIFGLCSTCRG
ncbi:MAG: transcriptional repressor [Chloroflexi bacterium]|nr:transcriptional repressor [Chloroflexota bacterium]